MTLPSLVPPGHGAVWRKVATLKPEELQELLLLIEQTEQGVTGTVPETSIAHQVPALVQKVTATVTTSWNVEAPPIQSEAVKSLWASIKPANNAEALSTLAELRRWVFILLFVVLGGAGTQEVMDALGKAFDSVVESVTENGEPGATRDEGHDEPKVSTPH